MKKIYQKGSDYINSENIEAVEAEIVEGYSLDDFLETTKPFEDVYKFHSNPFEHQRAIEKMSCEAKKVGFTSFKGTYKNYIQSLNQAQRGALQVLSNPTEFSGQPIQLEAGKWQCDDSGVHFLSGFEEIYACHHPILPVECLENIDTGEEKLKIAYKKRNIWREIIVSKEILFNSSKIIQLSTAGVDVTSETAKHLVSYLQDIENTNMNEIPVRKSVSRLGYIGDAGFSPYVKGLIFDGDMNYSSIFNAIKEQGDVTKWFDIAKECRSRSLTARIVLSASFASVLVSLIGGLPFFVHLWGVDSGTGKTVALMLAASVWGSPEMGKYIQTFNATQVGHERTAAFLNNLPFFIDELQLSKDSHGKSKFDVYQLAQGVGRSRGTKTGGIDRTPTWSNCIITTGESPLTSLSSGAGAVNRVVDIECTSGNAVIYDGIKVSSVIKKNYGFAGKMFVEIVKTLPEKGIQNIYQQYFSELSSTDTTEKQAMAAAMILTADKLVTDHIFNDGKPLTTGQLSGYLQTKTNVSAGERGYKFMCDWVALNSNKFRTDLEIGDTYGVIQNGWVYIISSIFRQAAEKEGFSSTALLSWLKSNGYILTRGRNNTRGKRINGVLTDCIVMKLPEESDEKEEIELSNGVPF